MEILNNEKLSKINGGSTMIWFAIGALATFIIGAISGQIKLKWQNHKNTEFKGNSEGKPLIRIRRKD